MKVLMFNELWIQALVTETLSQVFIHNNRADRVLQRSLASHPALSEKDRGQIVDAVYDIIRYIRRLETAMEMSGEPSAADPDRWYDAWQLWRGLRPAAGEADSELVRRIESPDLPRAVRESVPDWLDARGVAERGVTWDALLAALNEKPQLVLRANTLKTPAGPFFDSVRDSGVPWHPLEDAPEAVVLEAFAPVFQWPAFKQGWFEIQDAASQMVAPFVEVRPGMRVVDACCGSGGKTLHLAALMRNRGRIIALDVDAEKLAELEKRARRAGATIIETRLITSTKIIKRLADSADRVLLDVPCSGTGVLRRNPDIKWRLRPEDLTRLLEEQQHLLSYYSRMVKPGGRLVYATCSVLPSEGEDQVRPFLQSFAERFSLVEEKRLDPHTFGFDGFYMAALQRTSL